MKILLMEDDPVLGEIISDYLREYYEVDHAFDSAEAERLTDRGRYDLFIFDINVPGKSGIALLEEMRSFSDTTPAIFITAYDDVAHLKRSFDAGAHDYIKKPFDLEELKLRIEKSKILFRIEQESAVKIDEGVIYYPEKRVVVNGEKERFLKPKEAEILAYFIAHEGRVVTAEELAQNLWEFDAIPSDATLRSYIRNLREIIPAHKIYTERGRGWRYE